MIAQYIENVRHYVVNFRLCVISIMTQKSGLPLGAKGRFKKSSNS